MRIFIWNSVYSLLWGTRNLNVDQSLRALPKETVTPLPPLSKEMPNLPPVEYSTVKSEESVTEVTVLSNGLRVASEKKFGQFCTAGGMLHICARWHKLIVKVSSVLYRIYFCSCNWLRTKVWSCISQWYLSLPWKAKFWSKYSMTIGILQVLCFFLW